MNQPRIPRPRPSEAQSPIQGVPRASNREIIETSYGVATLEDGRHVAFHGETHAIVDQDLLRRIIWRNGNSPALGALDYSNLLNHAAQVHFRLAGAEIESTTGARVTVPNGVAQFATLQLGVPHGGSLFTMGG